MQMTKVRIVAGVFLVTAVLLVTGAFALYASDSQQPQAQQTGQTPQPGKQPAGKPKSDQERMVGTWKLVDGQGNGEVLPVEFKALFRLAFAKDGKISMSVVEEAKAGTYKLPAAGQIDMTLDANDSGLGIYKFDGDDRLTMCFTDGPNSPRPKEFNGAAGTGHVLLVLERCKPGEEKVPPEVIAKYQEGVDKVKEAAARAQSQNNLKQFGLAMHAYHDTHGHLPAHAIYSKDGKTPLLSWRVAILPYIEQGNLYQQFKLDEPWDSEHNKKLIAKMPRIYEPLGMGKKGEGLTYYQVFIGPDTLFDGPKVMKFADVTDGLSNTLLIVEGKEPVIWTKPADLTLFKDKNRLTPVGGLFKSGTNAAFCDGSVQMLARTLDAAQQRAMVTPRGND